MSGLMISQETAMAIAVAHREIEIAEKLLATLEQAVENKDAPDIRDAFGRHQSGLTLGVRSDVTSHRLYNVPWSLCRPIIEAHIEQQRAFIAEWSKTAMLEMGQI